MPRFVAADQHVALGAEAVATLDDEARGAERVAHAARGRPGRDRRVASRAAGDAAHHLRAPHLGIARRREPVEVDRVDVGRETAQRRIDVVVDERQEDAAVVEVRACVPDSGGGKRAHELARELAERRSGASAVSSSATAGGCLSIAT